MKVAIAGTVWTARARLYNSAGKQIGTCTDTPNAIARALMENYAATAVKESYSDVARTRTEYSNRMHPGNTCPSGYTSK